MDRNRIAEFVLSCVLPPARAAAVAGDFAEDAVVRGSLWFWSSVLRMVAANVASDFTGRPVFMLAIGISGCLRCLWVLFVGSLVAGLFIRFYAGPPEWLAMFCILLWRVRCGMWLARYEPKSAIASCLAVSLLGWLWLGIAKYLSINNKYSLMGYALNDVLLISGALWARYRDVRPTWISARG